MDQNDLLVWDPVLDKSKITIGWTVIENCITTVHNNALYINELSSIRQGITGGNL